MVFIKNHFADLDRIYSRLSPLEQNLLDKCFSDLTEIAFLSAEQRPQAKNDLIAISTYIRGKLNKSYLLNQSAGLSEVSLRQLRNELFHRGSLLKFSPSQIKKLESLLWKTLERSSPMWDLQELSNLLAYCLQTPTPNLDILSNEPKKLIRIYTAIYNAFNKDQKNRAFKELALRVLTEKKILLTLNEMGYE